MQIDAEEFHRGECHRQHQRNRQRDDEPGAETQRKETHQQHDGDSDRERIDEFADRTLHRVRLIGDAVEIESDRQCAAQALHGVVEIAAEQKDVAAVAHRHGDAERILAFVAHARLLRIAVAALHVGDVAKAEQLSVRADGNVADRFDRIERTGRTQIDAIGRRLETARCGDRVLRFEHFLHLIETHAERGEFGVRQFDENLFVLQADQIDLRHVRHAQQFELDAFGVIAELRVVVAFAGQRVDVAERIAEFIVEERPDRAGRQCVADVADFLAHLIEHVGHFRGVDRILDHHEHVRFAGTRIAAQEIQFGDFLQLLLDLVGYLQTDFVRRRARPLRLHHHHLEGERRIFGLAESGVRPDADQRQHHDEIAQQRPVVQRPLGQVESRHGQTPEDAPTRPARRYGEGSRADSGGAKKCTFIFCGLCGSDSAD